MKHLGDITKISGAEVPVVDVVIGGSPCQDLSIAGAGKGLGGSRSSLFFEQIRVIKEMRENDIRSGRSGVDVRPRYMVWENVPNALSIHGGEDFRIVLEETARVADKTAVIPRPKKWSGGGCILADRWSIAWRIHDAQFWGVPQRRRRIALVADFGGQSAPEILFERNGLCWDSSESKEPREGTSAETESGVGSTISFRERCGCEGGGKGILIQIDKVGTISCHNDQAIIDDSSTHSNLSVYCLQGNSIDRSDTAGCNGRGWRKDVSYTLNTIDRHAVYDAQGNGNGETVPTITGDHENRVTDYTAVVMATGQANAEITVDKSPTLNCNHEAPIVAAVDCRNGVENAEVNGMLQAKSTGGQSLNLNNVVREAGAVRRLTPVEANVALYENHPADSRVTGPHDICQTCSARWGTGGNNMPIIKTEQVVRRLTVTECERLQGFPDGYTDIGDWTDSKGKTRKTTDSARYKALGNSIALPFWRWMLTRLCNQYIRPASMASLFDGIGGFPYLWEQINGRGSCTWASEVDEFCIAVTERRINQNE